MKTLLTNNLSTKAVSAGGSAWTPPPIEFGESLTIAQRFLEEVDGESVEPDLTITAFAASVGVIDARPESGTWKLRVGPEPATVSNTTAALPYNATARQVADAINALSAVVTDFGLATVRFEDESWLIFFAAATEQVELELIENALWPASFGKVSATETNEVWEHELRLVQVPVAATSSAEFVLPPAPTITRVQAGGSDGGYSWNEVQTLFVPPDFRGSYRIRWGDYARTVELSSADAAEDIQTALVAAIGQGAVTVTNTVRFSARIEFVNALAGTEQPLLVVEPAAAPVGDYTWTIDFDKPALQMRLRRAPTVELPLQVWLWVEGEDEVVRKRTAFSVLVTIRRPLVWPELALLPVIDWERPLSPVSYAPFSRTTVLDGQKFFVAQVGNGSATTFPVIHGLATEVVFAWVRQNVSGGWQLIEGTDYRIKVIDADSVEVHALGAAPALNAWFVAVMSAQTVASFANGLTVEMAQVTGLAALLESIGGDLADILALLPTTPVGASTTGGAAIVTIEIPEKTETFPGQLAEGGTVPSPLGGLLPALHVSSVTSQTTGTLPSLATSAGTVISNNTAGALVLPGGMGTRSSSIPVGGYGGCDGRRWYPLSRGGSTNSYFPRDFERELWFFEVNSQMLRAGTSLLLTFAVKIRLLQAISRAQYFLVVEHASVTSQTSPATTSTNLSEVVWNAVPLLAQRLILGDVAVEHNVGFQIIRDAVGALSANKILYGLATPADSVPASADVALRARLIQFDTQNSVPSPKGAIAYTLEAASAVIH